MPHAENSMINRLRFIIVLACPFLMAAGIAIGLTDPQTEKNTTNIVLDSMGNTIFLKYENGRPAYYYSNIFTPVCNTGECLPVFINLYWNLDGTYMRFDQPKGEILTKLDHVPFTPEDYTLLDEILRGSDPRYGMIIEPHRGSESQPQPGRNQSNKEDQLANPAPAMQSKKMISKYEMIDGVTGATAITHQAQFVPGALYTTYTIWGLAHDQEAAIKKHTTTELLSNENLLYYISNPHYGLQALAFEKFYEDVEGSEERAKLLMGIFDTANAEVANALFNYIQYEFYPMDTVSHTLERKFFNTDNADLKRRILYSWIYNFCPDHIVPVLAADLPANQELMYEHILLFSVRYDAWSKNLLSNLLTVMPDLTTENQQTLITFLEDRKEAFSKEEWEQIQHAIKKYK